MGSELQSGSQGAVVRSLHQLLHRLGYRVTVEERRTELFGPSTEQALSALQSAAGLTSSGRVDAATEARIAEMLKVSAPPTQFRVRGTIRRRDGSAAVGVSVSADDRDLFATQLLVTVCTNDKGQYEIQFPRGAFVRADRLDRLGPDLVVRASDGDRETASPIHFNAGTETVVDLVLGGGEYSGPSEWTRFTAVLAPVLAGHGANELNETHIDFLVGETDFVREIVVAFIAAVQIAEQAQALHAAVPADAVYAIIRQGGPATLEPLALTSDQLLQKWLVAAQGGLIPHYADSWIESTLQAFARLRERVAGASPLGHLGQMAGLSTTAATRFADRYVQHRGPISELWASLRADPELAPHVPSLQRLSHLGSLARGHLPLVRMLEARFQSSHASSLGAFLASIDDAAWLALARATGTPANLQPEDYASLLASTVEEAFPTHVVVRHLAGVEMPQGEAVRSLLLAHAETHDIGEHPVVSWFADGRAPAPEIIDEASRVQRLYKVSGAARDLPALLALPLRSAGDIIRIGRVPFVESSRDKEKADRIYDRARRQHEAALLIWSRYDDHVNHPLGSGLDRPVSEKDKPRVPGYERLFGSLDFCGCEECRSVYGPAAYLTDLLAFTDRVASGVAGNSIREYLYSDNAQGATQNRRADLGKIELTCENTNRVLPMIDLVNELLEYVALGPAQLAAHGLPLVPSYQSTRPSAELIVTPEHVADAAYDDVLAKAAYPWTLPFDLGMSEARVFLGQLGVERAQLMALLASSPVDRAVEDLGLAPADIMLLTSATTATHDLFGLPTQLSVADPRVPNSPPQLARGSRSCASRSTSCNTRV